MATPKGFSYPFEVNHNSMKPDTNKLVDHLFRTEAGKMTAVLTRLFGFKQYETAKDIVQETILMALKDWQYNRVPENPTAWLYKVAKNKAIDYLRRENSSSFNQFDFNDNQVGIRSTFEF